MKKLMTMLIAAAMVFALAGVAFVQEADAAKRISLSKARSIALKDAGLKRSGAAVMESEYDDGAYEVEFTKKRNGAEYDYKISTRGRILKKSVEYVYTRNSSTEMIGEAQAQKTAAKFAKAKLSKVKNGTCYYEYDDGKGTYTVKFRKGRYLWDVEILAPTGQVIEFSKKYRR